MKARFCRPAFFRFWLSMLLAAGGLAHAGAAADLDPVLLGGWPSRYATARAVSVQNDQAYLATSDHGFLILDLTDRSNPKWLGGYQTRGDVGGLAASGDRLYVADDTEGLLVLDVSQPASPRQVGAVPIAYADDVVVYGDYGYATADEVGLAVIDLADPANPRLIGTHALGGDGRGIAVSGDHLYVVDNERGLHVFALTVPAAPQQVGQWETGGAWGVAVADDLVAVGVGYGGVQLIDVSNPAWPKWVGECSTGHFAGEVARSGHFVFVADGNGGLLGVDVANPSAPGPLVRFGTGRPATDVVVLGVNLYAAVTPGVLEIVDVQDPYQPHLVGGYEARGQSQAAAVMGRYAYLADGYRGVRVIDLLDATQPRLVGQVDPGGFAWDAVVSGSQLYVAAHDTGLAVIDLADPIRPGLMARANTVGFVHRVAHDGPYVYAATGVSGLEVIDVSDSANPRRCGGVATAGSAWDVVISARCAYGAEGSSGVELMDIGEPAQPKRVGGFEYRDASAARLAVGGSRLFIADWGAGLVIVDAANPAGLRELGRYPEARFASAVAVAGNTVVLGTESLGLHVIDISNPLHPRRVGGNSAFPVSGLALAGDQVCLAAGAAGLAILYPFTALSEEELTRPFVERHVLGFRVELLAAPPFWTQSYAVTERPPFGVVHHVSHGGTYDRTTRTITFGPFLDHQAHTLTYEVEPPDGATGCFPFSGEATANGFSSATVGDDYLEIPPFPPLDARLLLRRRPLSQQTALQMVGGTGAPCFVLTSTNLKDWVFLGELRSVIDSFELVDTEAPAHPHRFYRAQTILPPADPRGGWAYEGFDARGSLIVTGTVYFATSTNPLLGRWDFQPVHTPHLSGHFVGKEAFKNGEVSGSLVTVRQVRAIDLEFVLSGQMVGGVYRGAWQLNVEGPPETGTFVAHRIRP